jgi:hypothetical protein
MSEARRDFNLSAVRFEEWLKEWRTGKDRKEGLDFLKEIKQRYKAVADGEDISAVDALTDELDAKSRTSNMSSLG